jgi:hypothetical protein
MDSLRLIYSKLWVILDERGFLPMTEFSAVDSLIHKDEMLGVMCFEGSQTVAEAITYSSGEFCIETDHRICLHLYGKSGDFVDYEDLTDACYNVFYDVLKDNDLLIVKMDISKAVQSMPLKRLERCIEFTVRTIEGAEVE